MKVYIVTRGCYSDYGIETVFSTRKLAELYQSELRDSTSDILEMEVDGEVGFVRRKCFYASIDLKTGDVVGEYQDSRMASPTLRSQGDGVQVCSFVSAEHARKLAVEKRQEWLRKIQTE